MDQRKCALYFLITVSVSSLDTSHCQDDVHYSANFPADQGHRSISSFSFNKNDDDSRDNILSSNQREEMAKYGHLFRDGFLGILRENLNASVLSPYLSATCYNDTLRIIDDALNSNHSGHISAMAMLDADGKPPAGFLEGNWLWMGNYDECSNVEFPYSAITGHGFHGKYCFLQLTSIKTVVSLPLTLGVCIPSTCNSTELMYMADKALNFYTGAQCLEKETKLSDGAIATIVVCSLLLFLMVIGTVVDVLCNYIDVVSKLSPQNINGSTLGQSDDRSGLLSNVIYSNEQAMGILPPAMDRSKLRFLIAFSIINNTRKLLNTSTATGQLTSINGMRVLSMWWVILGHTYLFVEFFTDNLAKAITIPKRWTFQPILNGSFSVDTFFFMSGLLVAFTCIKKLQESGRINWAMFYFHRFWRLTPVYAFFLLFWTFLFARLLTGPLSMVVEQGPYSDAIKYCKKYWWTNLLYINNFHPNMGDISKQCMGWSWYLANDMQFYIISPLILILLYKFKKIGILATGYLIASNIFIRAMTVFEFGMLIPNNRHTKNLDNYYSHHSPLYNKPYTRMIPFLVGILLGYFLQVQKCRLHMKKVLVLLGWIIAMATGLSVAYGLYYYCHNSVEGTLAVSVVYQSLSRFAWSLAIAWVILACATGNGGPVNKLLSWKFWAPLGRLTYCAYLVHPAVLYFYIFSMETPLHVTDLTMMYLYMGNLITSYAVAFVLSMAVEAPMLELEKIIFCR